MIILYIVGGLVGLVALLALVGLTLPRSHVAARRVLLAQAPGEVWRVLVDREGHVAWRAGLTRVERVSPSRVSEHDQHGALTLELREDRVEERLITEIADESLPYGGRWIYELSPVDGGTRLTITEDGFIKNPIFRVLSRTVFSTTATVEAFLRDLGKHLGSAAPVEPARPSVLVSAPPPA